MTQDLIVRIVAQHVRSIHVHGVVDSMEKEVLTGTIIVNQKDRTAVVYWHDNDKLVNLYKAFGEWFKEFGKEHNLEVELV